jgi:large subunit ribosomal protein L24
MKIKTGDKVKIISGKDQSKTGKILQVFKGAIGSKKRVKTRVSVEGLNLLIKHMRPRKQGEKGQRIEFPAPMDASNVMLICPNCDKPARVGYKITEVEVKGKKENKKFRFCKKCKQIIN